MMTETDRGANDTIDLRDILHMLVRRKWLVIGITGGIAVIALMALLLGKFLPVGSPLNLLPDRYTSTARIYIRESMEGTSITDILRSSGVMSSIPIAGLATVSPQSNTELIEELLHSSSLLDKAADRLNLVQRLSITIHPRISSRKALLRNMSTEFSGTSGMMTIAYTDTDREFATRTAALLIDLLAEEYRRITLDQVRNKMGIMEEVLAAQERAAAESSRSLEEFQKQFGIMDVATTSAETNRTITQLQSQLTQKQLEMRIQSRYLPSGDPKIVKLEAEIEALNDSILLVRAGVGGSPAGIPHDKFPELQQRYATLRRDADLQQRILNALQQQFSVIRLEVLNDTAMFYVVDEPEVPEMKSAPSRTKLAVMATFAGGLIGLLVASIVDYLSGAMNDPAERISADAIKASLGGGRRRKRYV